MHGRQWFHEHCLFDLHGGWHKVQISLGQCQNFSKGPRMFNNAKDASGRAVPAKSST